MRGHNARNASERSRLRFGDPLDALDKLPTPLRRALHEAITTWDPRETLIDLKARLKAGEPEVEAIAAEVAAIREADRTDIRSFRYHWPSRFGVYPAAGARSTILRYDEAERLRDGAPSADTPLWEWPA
jgi:hypothetical protein